MDESPATPPRRAADWASRLHRRTPLRVRLIVTVLLLVAVALVGSGVAARATLSGYLIGRVDGQLAAVAGPMADHAADRRRPFDGDRDAPPDARQLPSPYVTEVVGADGDVLDAASGYLATDEPLPALRAVGPSQATRFFTVGARTGDGTWRVVAVPVPGSGDTLLVAQSLRDTNATLDHLTLLLVVIGAAALLVIAAVGYVVVRASLRPLRAVEKAAATIAAGDLSHRVPEADPRTEVGHLSGALNTMLGEIETAFAQRAASEQAARSSEDRAVRSEERMRRFVADASHELRTPLTTIRGFAELYRQGAVAREEDVRRLMRRIEDEAKRMGLLVEDLLLLARMDQERPLARQPVDLLALAGEVVQDTRAIAPERPIRLEVGCADPPPVVLGDETRLRQVLVNLLSNAVRHTPTGTPVTVRVSTGTGEHSRAPAVLLSVADEGPGLPPEAAARVFERFYRADAARNRADGGTGLGLAIVAALVAGHGGHVEVRSAPGAGACFRVELPLADRTAGGGRAA